MKPVTFPGCNVTFAENQPEYLPLPTYAPFDPPTFPVTDCWKMTWRERIRVLFTGRIYVTLLTFRQPLQPKIVSVFPPEPQL